MSGNGGDNAHNNAFGGGGRGPTGGVNGTSGKGGPTGNGPGGRLPSGGINGSGNGANVGHGGSMTVDLGNGITAILMVFMHLNPVKTAAYHGVATTVMVGIITVVVTPPPVPGQHQLRARLLYRSLSKH